MRYPCEPDNTFRITACPYCVVDATGNHQLHCSLRQLKDIKFPTPERREILVSQQCGRCWHNHIPGSGTVCQCGCHSSTGGATSLPPIRW